jgi:nickel-dependent lactate racemase
MTGTIVSSTATRTKKSQKQDRLARTRVGECRSAHGCDRGQGQQVGDEEQGECREDERDIRRWRKRWCVHAVKHLHGRAIATAQVGVGLVSDEYGEEASAHMPSAKNAHLIVPGPA